MLIVALQHCGLDPSFAVGGDLGEAGTNAHHGSSDVFVAEADESDGSLLEYSPDVAVVTNIEVDHLDFYGSVAAYTAVFDDFADRVKSDGALVVCVDDPGAAALAERAAARGVRVLRYGSGDDMRSADDAQLAAVLTSWEQHGTGAVAHVQLAGDVRRRDGDGERLPLRLGRRLKVAAPTPELIDAPLHFFRFVSLCQFSRHLLPLPLRKRPQSCRHRCPLCLRSSVRAGCFPRLIQRARAVRGNLIFRCRPAWVPLGESLCPLSL